MTLSEEESASAIAEYAAKQKALREEAERKAQEARERETSGGGATPSPNEGGAEELECQYGLETGQGPVDCEDPEHSEYLTVEEAQDTAFAFRLGGAAAVESAEELLGPVGGLLAGLAQGYLNGVAHNLELCAGLIGPPISGDARCKLTLYTWKVPIVGLEIPYRLGVAVCIPYGTRLRCGKSK